jgi:hypothetical protein
VDAATVVGADKGAARPDPEADQGIAAMKKSDRPSEYFVGAILRGFDKAELEGKRVTCGAIWNYVVMECLRQRGGFETMFAWDTSKAKSKNRIRDIMACIERGHVPELRLWHDGQAVFVERC